MRGHLGPVLTTGLAVLALALALLQAAVVSHGVIKHQPTAAHSGATNRFSAPGGRSGIPWVPQDGMMQPKPVAPESPEGRTPPRRQQEEHRSPPPSRFRNAPPRPGPQPARRAVA